MIKKNLAATDCFYIFHSHKAYYSTIRTCVIGTAYLLYPQTAYSMHSFGCSSCKADLQLWCICYFMKLIELPFECLVVLLAICCYDSAVLIVIYSD